MERKTKIKRKEQRGSKELTGKLGLKYVSIITLNVSGCRIKTHTVANCIINKNLDSGN